MEFVTICPKGHGPFDTRTSKPRCPHCCARVSNAMDRGAAEAELRRINAARAPSLEFPWGPEPIGEELKLGVDPEFSPLADEIQKYLNPSRDPGARYVVSRTHAVVRRQDGAFTIRDCQSTNRTRVNGEIIGTDPHPLVDGAEILLSRKFKITARLS